MKNLAQLEKNDIVSLKYGSRRIKAIIIENNNCHIIWHSLEWKKCYSETYTYLECKESGMFYIGKHRSILKRIISLDFSSIEFKY